MVLTAPSLAIGATADLAATSSATMRKLELSVIVKSACLDTQIVSHTFDSMVIEVGQTTAQTFSEFDDTMSLDGFLCGNKTYNLITTLNCINLTFNVTTNEYELTLSSVSEDDVGSHIATLEVSLSDYLVPPLTVEPFLADFSIIINTAINLPP